MRKLTALLAAGMVFGASGMAMAGQSATVSNAQTNATLIAPIAITESLTLEFGKIVKGAGTVTIASADGARSDSAAANTLPGIQTGTVRAAEFSVTGEGSMTYAITLPNTVVLATAGGGAGKEMTASAFESTPTVAASGTLSGGGTQTLKVGALLTVAGTETLGAYSGVYAVTVAYN